MMPNIYFVCYIGAGNTICIAHMAYTEADAMNYIHDKERRGKKDEYLILTGIPVRK